MTVNKPIKAPDAASDAAEAYADLVLAAAIINMCEGGDFSSDCHAFTRSVVRLCKTAQQRALRRYDQAIDRLPKD